MVGFSEDPAWGKTCTPGKSSNTGPYSERSAWDNACTSASFIPPSQTCIRLTENIDLATLTLSHGIKLIGAAATDYSGYSVSGVGDVNKDGFADFIIGASGANPGGRSSAGESYLIYGTASLPATIDLGDLGSAGIIITGAVSSDQSGWSVSGAGDVNNDGFADFIIGAIGADPGGRSNAGESYLIYGGDSLPATIDLGNLGSAGIKLTGAVSGDQSGRSVSGAGDVNKDGFADFIIGAFSASSNAGESYLIYGGDSLPATIDLLSLGSAGIKLTGAVSGDYSGHSVSGAGDVNKDGFADFIIGAYSANPGGRTGAGESYLIYGSASLSTTIDLGNLGSDGITITGAVSGDNSGSSVSGAGDVDKDGFADFIIGAHTATPGGRSYAGESYIIYGTASLPTTIDLGNLGSDGITITGAVSGGNSGWSVSGAGDVDKDGFADFIIGAYTAGGSNAGESYLIYGGTSLPTIMDLGNLGSDGITITGAAGDFSGSSVSGAGDVTGDGCSDFIIGAYAATPEGRSGAGESYLIL
jgi:hypothetical protein